MCNNNETKESISHQIKDRVDSKLQVLLEQISVELAYDFMFSRKYEVSHDVDPPWDYSGRLIQLNGGFSFEDYNCIGDFLEEYSGETTPSFVSGCGFFHTRYEEKYGYMIQEFIYECCKEVLSEAGEECLLQLLLEQGYEVSEEELKDIIQMVMDIELFDEPSWYYVDILDQIKPINFKLMVLRGKREAIQRHNDKEKRDKEQGERLIAEQLAAECLWSKLLKLYKLQFGKKIYKVEMKDYEMFKRFLDNNQISLEERIILASHLNGIFSNKVREHLKS